MFLGRYQTKDAGFSAAEEYVARFAAIAANGETGNTGENAEKSFRGRVSAPGCEYKYVRKMKTRWRAEGYRGKNMMRAHLGMYDTKKEAIKAVAKFHRSRELRAGQR